MKPLNLNIPHYPMLRLVVRHGPWLAYVIGIGVFIAAFVTLPILGAVPTVGLGIAAGVVVFVVARTLVELVQLITDMLLPK